MHILISPNAFKNSLDAAAAAKAIEKGFIKSRLSCTCTCFPVGDGGDGTGTLLMRSLNATTITARVNDPLGRKIKSSFGLIDGGKTAIIEMANASGLRLLSRKEYDPMRATTYGTGELIKAALNRNVDKIIIGIGGSATVEGGAGILEALGIRFLNKKGQQIGCAPAKLMHLDKIDLSELDPRLTNTKLIILCDVDNKLLGKNGAAAVFGPQKGASKKEVNKLDRALKKLRRAALDGTGKDMSAMKFGGAAGGVAAGLSVFINAELVTGIDYFLDMLGFDDILEKSDLVITGEGSIDWQTLQGKGPFGVAVRAKKKNIPVIGLAGKLPLQTIASLKKYFDVLMPINNDVDDLQTALQSTKKNLIRTSEQIGNLIAISGKLQTAAIEAISRVTE